ncbi:hypothetical Protein YC6258_00839 [Gynuella sunshinyii YC6258]|uniref:Uncharacterized protein n=1 Tax=Gynuella sunshinyii YC6258 TaxID=1445510 RepID=A0A0C5VRJ6_9GAMM|nr:hypothetical Protein YC6258_00839 [Gynuella sunshinyii YC6258]
MPINWTACWRKPLNINGSYERTFIDLELIAQNKKLVKSFFQAQSVSFAAG